MKMYLECNGEKVERMSISYKEAIDEIIDNIKYYYPNATENELENAMCWLDERSCIRFKNLIATIY